MEEFPYPHIRKEIAFWYLYGMTEEPIAHIFHRYYQRNHSRSSFGLGLGFSIAHRIIELCNGVVVFLTTKSAFDDKRKGFASDIDDYMTKPVNYEELLWRIQALLRRTSINTNRRITIGSVNMDADSYTVSRGKEPIELSKYQPSAEQIRRLERI